MIIALNASFLSVRVGPMSVGPVDIKNRVMGIRGGNTGPPDGYLPSFLLGGNAISTNVSTGVIFRINDQLTISCHMLEESVEVHTDQQIHTDQ